MSNCIFGENAMGKTMLILSSGTLLMEDSHIQENNFHIFLEVNTGTATIRRCLFQENSGGNTELLLNAQGRIYVSESVFLRNSMTLMTPNSGSLGSYMDYCLLE